MSKLFKECKTKLTLVPLISALVVISTASLGMIYAQWADDSEGIEADDSDVINYTSAQ